MPASQAGRRRFESGRPLCAIELSRERPPTMAAFSLSRIQVPSGSHQRLAQLAISFARAGGAAATVRLHTRGAGTDRKCAPGFHRPPTGRRRSPARGLTATNRHGRRWPVPAWSASPRESRHPFSFGRLPAGSDPGSPDRGRYGTGGRVHGARRGPAARSGRGQGAARRTTGNLARGVRGAPADRLREIHRFHRAPAQRAAPGI